MSIPIKSSIQLTYGWLEDNYDGGQNVDLFLGTFGQIRRLNRGGHFNCVVDGKSMLCSLILFQRCRTCHSQSRCWICGRRGTSSTSCEWRARSKACGQSFGKLNQIGRRWSTKTFRYTLVWCNQWQQITTFYFHFLFHFFTSFVCFSVSCVICCCWCCRCLSGPQ